MSIQKQVFNFAVLATQLLPAFLSGWKLHGNQEKIDEKQKTIEILRNGLIAALFFILVLVLLMVFAGVFVLWLYLGKISKENEELLKLNSKLGLNLVYWLIGVLALINCIQLCYIFHIKRTFAKREFTIERLNNHLERRPRRRQMKTNTVAQADKNSKNLAKKLTEKTWKY